MIVRSLGAVSAVREPQHFRDGHSYVLPAAASAGFFLLGLRLAGAARCNARDFCGVEKHTRSDVDSFELSGALQPEERGFANFQNRQSLGARK
jgi:hypothetical protein